MQAHEEQGKAGTREMRKVAPNESHAAAAVRPLSTCLPAAFLPLAPLASMITAAQPPGIGSCLVLLSSALPAGVGQARGA